MQRRALAALGVAILVTVLAGTGVWWWSAPGPERPPEPTPTPALPEPPLELTLTPTLSDRLGVASSSAFALTANRPLDPAAVQAGLSVEPAVELRVVVEDGRLLLVPSGALGQDETYRFSLTLGGRSFSWAFKTHAPFKVLDTLPRDGAAAVPLDTRIEIRFSHEDFEPSADHFVIGLRDLVGEARGRFEVSGNVWAFVPDALQANTVYRITVKSGLRVRDSHLTLDRDFTFTFFTTIAREEAFTPSGPFEFATAEAPVLRSFSSPEGLAKEYEVAVFSYPDASAFMKALAAQPAPPEATDQLARVASFRSAPQPRPPGSFGASLAFPGPLPAGFYLAELRATPGRTTQQVRFQVTDISYFVSVTATKTLLWLNDLSTKAPLAQAQLETGGQRVTVGPDGVVVLPTALEKGRVRSVYRVSAPGKEAVVSIAHAFSERMEAGRYWRYLYLDRPVYRPDDTVRFWGVLAARETGAAPVDQVRVSVSRPGGASVVEVTVPVRAPTFAGELTLPGLPPGDHQLEATAGGVQVWLGSVKVETFAKPTHKLELTANPRVAVTGDDVEFRARVIRSDGTPAANVPITFDVAGSFDAAARVAVPPIQAVATTDARGEATLRRTVRIVDQGFNYNANFEWFGVDVRARTGTGELASSVWLPVFPSRAHVSATSTWADGRGEVRVLVRELSLARVNRGESGPEPDIYLGRTLADRPLTVTLIRGSDNVSLGTVTLRTDASGQARYSFAVEPDKSYRVSVTALDDAQRSTTRSVRVSGPAYRELPSQRWLGTAGRMSWRVGETVELTFLLRDSKTPPPRPQAFLFYTLRQGLDRHEVRSDPVFRFTFREEDVPAAHARGVYFDGRAYQMTWDLVCGSIFRPTTPVRADTSARELSVTIRPDRPEYRPGDTVRLDVDVRDRAGQPVRANVNLSVGDGASLPLKRQEVDGLPSYASHLLDLTISRETLRYIQLLDGPVSPEAMHHASHSDSEFMVGGCEGPGPLVVPTLQDPRITAFFSSLTTDADGRATASFTLPADLTGWLLTYHAVTPRRESARGVVDLRVRHP